MFAKCEFQFPGTNWVNSVGKLREGEGARNNVLSANETMNQLNTELSKGCIISELPVEIIHQIAVVIAGNPSGRELSSLG